VALTAADELDPVAARLPLERGERLLVLSRVLLGRAECGERVIDLVDVGLDD